MWVAYLIFRHDFSIAWRQAWEVQAASMEAASPLRYQSDPWHAEHEIQGDRDQRAKLKNSSEVLTVLSHKSIIPRRPGHVKYSQSDGQNGAVIDPARGTKLNPLVPVSIEWAVRRGSCQPKWKPVDMNIYNKEITCNASAPNDREEQTVNVFLTCALLVP